MQIILTALRPFREAFRKELERCELCRRGSPQLHEIAQGYGKRVKALGDRSLIVGLCSGCHRRVHSMGLKGKVLCLALLLLRRPQDFNLPNFWSVNGRVWPDPEEVWEVSKTLD